MNATFRTFAAAAFGLFAATAVADTVLTKDEDWSGQEATLLTGTIDLNGHNLTISQLAGDCEITDSSVTAYARLEYIQSNGKQYIDTGYKHGATTAVDMKIQFSVLPDNNWYSYYGARTASGNVDAFGAWVWSSGKGAPTYHCINSKNVESLGEVLVDTDYVAHWVANGDCTINGMFLGTYAKTSCVYTDYIFATNEKDNPKLPSKNRLYYCQVRTGETLERDFVPARRTSDGALGLLDLAHLGTDAEFYENKGSDTFRAGATTGYIFTKPGSAEQATPGELHVNVASGTIENTTVALTGSMKLVKEGAGTFVPRKYNQTYAGGNEIAAGTIKLYNASSDSTAYAMDQPGGKQPLGVESQTVVVKTGATLDLSGLYDTYLLHYELAGGTVVNSLAQKWTTYSSFGNAVQTEDSSFSSPVNTVISAPIDLGGKNLTVNITGNMALFMGKAGGCNGTFANGTLTLQGPNGSAGGRFQVDGAVKQMTDVDIDMKGCALSLNYDVYVRDLTVSTPYGSTTAEDNGHLYIGGTYTPVTDYIHNYVMQDGSTLNLGGKTAAWNCGTLTFADNAAITVIPPNRLGKIVDWAGHAPDSRVTFKLAKGVEGRLVAKDDGLYLRRGLIITVK